MEGWQGHVAAQGGFGVSAAGESWLIPGWSFHTKPLSARPGNGVSACWDPWLSWDHEGPSWVWANPLLVQDWERTRGFACARCFIFVVLLNP